MVRDATVEDLESAQRYMRRAIELSRNGLGRVSPNPPVGCVLVQDDRVIGEGWHEKFGNPHAEVNALAAAVAAGHETRGATAYVTLMPCAHTGKTPPCTQALIKAEIARVVVAVDDPNPESGAGREILQAAGIQVNSGILSDEAVIPLRGFLKRLTNGLPFVTLKYAMTLDGHTATASGDSQWISSAESRDHVQQLRAEHDAVMVGLGTALADDPRLNVRNPDLPQPRRIIIDSQARLSPQARMFNEPGGEILLLTCQTAAEKIKPFQALGATVLSVPPGANGGVDLTAALRLLADQGLALILCEGGATLAGGLVAANLVDEFVVFIAPKISGGKTAPGGVGGEGIVAMADAVNLQPFTITHYGEDICLRALVKKK